LNTGLSVDVGALLAVDDRLVDIRLLATVDLLSRPTTNEWNIFSTCCSLCQNTTTVRHAYNYTTCKIPDTSLHRPINTVGSYRSSIVKFP